MSEARRDRAALSPPLLLGIALTAAYFPVGVVAHLAHGRVAGFELPAGSALSLIGNVLLAFGVWALADRHRGQVRRGLRVAAFGWSAMLVLRILGELAFPLDGTGVVVLVVAYASFAAMLGVTIGLAIALWRGHALLAMAMAIVWLASALTTTFAREVFVSLGHDTEAVWVLQLVFWVMRLALLIAIMLALVGEAAPEAPVPSARALRRVARALRFTAGVMVPALLALSHGTYGGVTGLVALRGPSVLLGAVAFVALGLALLGAARDRDAALPSVPLVLSGVLALWCGRMMLAALPELVGPWLDRPLTSGQPYLLGVTLLTVPVVLMIGSVVLAITIGVLARRRALGDLRCRAVHHATAALIASVVAPLFAVELHSYCDLPALEPLVMLVVSVLQLGLLARLCDHAARAVDHGAALPAARVVRA